MKDLQQVALCLLAAGVVVSLVWMLVNGALLLRGRAGRGVQRHQPRQAPDRQAQTGTIRLGPPRPARVPMPPIPNGPRIRRGPPLVVRVHPDPLWAEKGWRRNGRGYEGSFQAGRRRWRGLVCTPYPGGFQAYIWDPPLAELEHRTRYKPCFVPTGDGPYAVHFHDMPSSLDHAITSVEAVLAQAVSAR